MALPITINVLGVFRDVQADGQKIGETIPDFTIENGQLSAAPNTQGFIYQTDSIIFTFDPDGNRTPADIASDVTGSVIAVGLLKDQLVIRIPSSGFSTSMLDSNQLEFDYSEPALRNLNGQAIRETLSNQAIPWLIKSLSFCRLISHVCQLTDHLNHGNLYCNDLYEIEAILLYLFRKFKDSHCLCCIAYTH